MSVRGPWFGERFDDMRLPADPCEAGFAYGRACEHLLAAGAREVYIADMMRVNRTEPGHLLACARAWADRLPARYREQMAAMAAGARVRAEDVERFLFADIAPPAPGLRETGPRSPEGPVAAIETPQVGASADESGAESGATGEGPMCSGPMSSGPMSSGPMCSGLVIPDRALGWRRPWIGRNCDWLSATLRRGTCAVRHRVPGRIPCVALGLMGDLDVDTGMNAAGLWLHLHTLLAMDEPRAGVSCISWLFWLREALETCESLAELEAFIARTDRDRGVIVVAADARNAEAAIYECTRSTSRRVDPWAEPGSAFGPRLIATNHPRSKHPAELDGRSREPAGGVAQERSGGAQVTGRGSGRAGSTITRCARLIHLYEAAHPEVMPDDLQEILADPLVEMRETCMSASLRTIYSAVADPGGGVVYFASGGCPAASRGVWRRVDVRL